MYFLNKGKRKFWTIFCNLVKIKQLKIDKRQDIQPSDLLGTARLPAPSPPNMFINISNPVLFAAPIMKRIILNQNKSANLLTHPTNKERQS